MHADAAHLQRVHALASIVIVIHEIHPAALWPWQKKKRELSAWKLGSVARQQGRERSAWAGA